MPLNNQTQPTGPAGAKVVIVVGGGLAGIAAAAALDSCGYRVTLLEARRELGGRASSFDDPESDQLLDNCQHVLLGCCTNLQDLYTRLNVANRIEYHWRVHFLDSHGKQFDLWGVVGLPAPLHLGPAMLGFSALAMPERKEIITAMLAMLRLGKRGREKLEGQAFGQWLAEHRQSDRVIQRFYDPVLISALNEDTRKASSKYAGFSAMGEGVTAMAVMISLRSGIVRALNASMAGPRCSGAGRPATPQRSNCFPCESKKWTRR